MPADTHLMPSNTVVDDESTTAAARPDRHPCLYPFAFWCLYFAAPIVVAAIARSPAWLLLSVPPLGWIVLLGGALKSGYPTVGVEETERLDRMLIDVGGVDAFGVVAQDHTDSPVLLRYTKRPTIIAASDFVRSASDDVLRGVAALQHAALSPGTGRRVKRVRAVGLLFVFIVALIATILGPREAGPLLAFATLGFSLWLIGAVAAAWSRSRVEAAGYAVSDREAARLAGSAQLVAAALVEMHAWREARRGSRSGIARIAHRVILPVRPTWHELERAATLREQLER
jgi:hypothetical protein